MTAKYGELWRSPECPKMSAGGATERVGVGGDTLDVGQETPGHKEGKGGKRVNPRGGKGAFVGGWGFLY